MNNLQIYTNRLRVKGWDSDLTPTLLDTPEFARFCDAVEFQINKANGLKMSALNQLFSDSEFKDYMCDALDALKSQFRIKESKSVLCPTYVIESGAARAIHQEFDTGKMFRVEREKLAVVG